MLPVSQSKRLQQVPAKIKRLADEIGRVAKKKVIIKTAIDKTKHAVGDVLNSFKEINPKYRRGSINIFPESTNKKQTVDAECPER